MAQRAKQYWLVKSEPETFSFDDLLAAPGRKTTWDGVRNYQARNYLRDGMQVGDGVLFYHSSTEPTAVVGIAEVASPAAPDPTQFEKGHDHFDAKSKRESPTWVQVEIRAVRKLPKMVELAALKASPKLASMVLLQRGSRLSVKPVTEGQWREVLRLGGERLGR
jgi:predicted RNA-binding protein with PUA-like domain